jgi:hypothetical protein
MNNNRDVMRDGLLIIGITVVLHFLQKNEGQP